MVREMTKSDNGRTTLHVSERLSKLLPALTSDEREQLKANIEADGRVTEPILYWRDGKQNIIIDGTHRWGIVRGTDLAYRTESMTFANYEEAETWILNHQLGRRNLLDPAAIRRIRGELYNRLKTHQGGDHVSQEAKCQIDTLLGDAAAKVAKKAGVSPATVKRDGARVETLAGLTKAARLVAENATDNDIKSISLLSEHDQNAVARAVRVGQAPNIASAIEATGAKPAKATTPPKRNGKPPKQYDRSAWFKSWEQTMGPLVRLVDKIASGLAESGCESQTVVHERLNDATEKMQKWMKVPDLGRCPVCSAEKWTETDDGVVCSRCNQPHGEPAGDPDLDRINTLRQKLIKTLEAGMRAFDDIQTICPRPEHAGAITDCKRQLAVARDWK